LKQVALWGPADHSSEADETQLAARIAALGFAPLALPRDAPPPAGASVVVVNTKRPVRRAAIDAMPRLEAIVTTTSGYEHVDVAHAAERGIAVARCPVARRDAVVETTLAMGLALVRRLPETTREIAAGAWTRQRLNTRSMPSIRGLEVLVVGHGVIGRRAAAAWRALGAAVTACDPADPDLPPLDAVIDRARILTLHCSLTPSSRRLLDRDRLARLPRGAIVINTARGECVDLEALLAAARSGAIGGVGLDVFEPEPPAASDFRDLRNALLLPHSAGYFDGLAAALRDEVVAALQAFAAGETIPTRVERGELPMDGA
jgi:phosphoglycerate dehydrogenase-like enzyme